MSDEKIIWLCPLCTCTLRSLEAFNAHMQRKLEVARAALAAPERCAKIVRPS